MRIISIAAPCNGSGKTSLLCAILKTFPGRFWALKCSTIYPDEEFCPTTDTDCACRNLDGDFVVINDEKTIRCPNTDTAKIAASGAIQTLWCLARPPHHDRLWKVLQSSYLDSRTLVLCEGSSLVSYMNPDLRLFVVHPGRPRDLWKKQSDQSIATADSVLINSAYSSPQLKSEIARIRGSEESVITEDVRRPVDQWQDQSLLRRISYLLINPL